jgi:hypothetical protein
MKTTPLFVLSVLAAAAAVAVAEETRPPPLPRARLDPAAREKTSAPPKYDPTVGPSPATMMERFVVRDRPLVLRAPQVPEPARGPFSLLDGGVLSGRNLGPVRMELGLAPPREVVAPLKTPRTQVQYSFLNFWW